MKIKIDNIFTGILVICALIVTFLLLKKEFFTNERTTNVSNIANWQKLITYDKKIGTSSSKVYLIEFFDYECPYCNTLEATLDTIRLKYNNKIKIIRYHFPLSIHPLAYRAAVASECASMQGYFDKYHKELMRNQYKLNSINFTELAKQIGIKDIGKFQKCIDYEETADVIAKDVSIAKEYKITGTPTLIINNKMISGVADSKVIEKIIEEFL
ncbi:DsbA family protein [Melioribacteraceae bacterium 4301-Me]|uniref:DsbA family protein n=1 Tax=Pyranulibacter aquaticus TaxID=3163344 RepID=UPI00359B10F2